MQHPMQLLTHLTIEEDFLLVLTLLPLLTGLWGVFRYMTRPPSKRKTAAALVYLQLL